MKWATACCALLYCSAAGAVASIELRVGHIEGAALPAPLSDVQVSCDLGSDAKVASCSEGRAAATSRLSGPVTGNFDLHVARDASWWIAARIDAEHIDLAATGKLLLRLKSVLKPQLTGSATLQVKLERSRAGTWVSSYIARLSSASFSENSGRYAAEKLNLLAQGTFALRRGNADLEFELSSSAGQAYVEPVFVDLAGAPLNATARLQFDVADGALWPDAIRSLSFDARQRGVFDRFLLLGSVAGLSTAPSFTGDLRIERARLDALLPQYAAPFLAGGRWQDLEGAGFADARLGLLANRPTSAAIKLDDIGLKAGTPAVQVDGLAGELHWLSSAPAEPSGLSWRGMQYGDLPIGAASIKAVAQGRDFSLLQAPRLPILGGAVVVDALELHDIGSAKLLARFAATIEPINLAALCKALGWPEFGGEISGRIPGVAIHDNELAFDGRLLVKAFDGEISIEDLRMPEVFGRLPRVLANLRLRNLDLKAITQAFSFGRIEGRLSGDVDELRLLSWRPVAFDARIYTPKDDRSRHRISQRAIDNLSSLGGGPSGILQRGVLRFFEDFAYERVGWSCRLENGICAMDGVEPAKNGGYVLVKGRLLPRIDVIGYERRVDWDRFLAQLLAIRGTEGVEVR
ncbi:MAG: hypothetical protein JWQ90_691 [Hydrocarboniphaga sp.]|uniref:hypothetical protein n=1 Tax=Hydrocarboniphaga sp. TaxID=2033016 RepID=UPI00263199AB|nr:hypothetical protein [Hydrocarboniphaga sp.]MDB5968241.1 hypothetical protein [Hydrocarboniphaga sp.]